MVSRKKNKTMPLGKKKLVDSSVFYVTIFFSYVLGLTSNLIVLVFINVSNISDEIKAWFIYPLLLVIVIITIAFVLFLIKNFELSDQPRRRGA